MKIEKESNWAKKRWKSSANKKSTKKEWATKMVADKKETNVSVITKTTTPKVVVKSEKMENNHNNSTWKNNLLGCIFFIVICIIILAIFFLSLQTYNTVNKLAEYIML